MINIPSVRLAVPKASAGEVSRKGLVDTVLDSPKKLIYINAGAGYGKTTLLSQVANSVENTVWVTLDGESDVFAFLNMMSAALRQTFSNYDFSASEFLPFEEKSNFVTILANAFINSIEKMGKDFVIILEDFHTTGEEQIRKLIACIMKYMPENIRLCISSREAPWQELIPMQVRGDIIELTQRELAFTRDEAAQVLGFDDVNIYGITEGWPLAIRSYKVLLENGVSLADLSSCGTEALYSYLFFECISRLSPEIVDFLKASTCFEELDPKMLDFVLNRNNTRLILESLVARNIFIVKTNGGNYRYHTLFRDYLLECTDPARVLTLQSKAAGYYFENKQYPKAAEYAIRSDNKERLEQIILISYKDHIKSGSFNELRVWFHALGGTAGSLNSELLVAKGAYLSSIGNFTEAKTCLDTAIPLLEQDNRELYVEAMVHKARVFRNFISFEASNGLLDELITRLDNVASELAYMVVIEKVYNLCWNAQINEAYALAYNMIEACAKAGNVKVKAWFERYLSVIHFLAGKMKDAVYYYEKSLELPENELRYLEMHNIDIYLAKAYQMLGERDKAVSIIAAELQKLRSTGRYEELWLGYLFAAEIHYQNTFIDRINGGTETFEATMKYFTLAEEYASLYRRTEFQMQWAKMQRHIYSLMFTDGPKEGIISEIFANLDGVSDYFKTIALARLFSYFGTVSDFPNAVKCAKLSIEIGEKANMMLIPTMAYGMLARAVIAMKDHEQSVSLTRRFLQLCNENGIYEYFRMRKAYDPILEFAFDNGIEPAVTRQMMEFAGFKPKKIYVQTLGGFSVFLYKDKQEPLKMRTKKERELFAFLLDAGSEGVTKEQICNAIWSESESEDVKKLIGVNLAHLKKDLESFGLINPVIKQNNRYSICRDEIVSDIELFEANAAVFEQKNDSESAQKLISLYKGEYLADFEALWAISNRIKFHEIYERALG
ncbi:MAG TPA: hypothetical protein VEG39_16620 [Clostridia bacterium]|nr:hypothetical protein [Clostridia bacterium]